MDKLIINKIIVLFLSILMSMVPIEVVLAGNYSSNLDASLVTMTIELDESTIQVEKMHSGGTLTQHNHSATNDNQSCDKQCANCVYCSAAAVTTLYTSITPYKSLFFAPLSDSLTGIDISVDIRPPINL